MTRQTTPEQREELRRNMVLGTWIDKRTRAVLADLEAAEAEVRRVAAATAMLREALEAALGALIWMSGSSDFGTGGVAEKGWQETRQGLLPRIHEVLAATADSDEWVKEAISEPGE